MLPTKRPGSIRKSGYKLIVCSGALALLGACASMPAPSSYMPYAASTAPPSGLIELCQSNPAICEPVSPARDYALLERGNVASEASSTGGTPTAERLTETVSDTNGAISLRGRADDAETEAQLADASLQGEAGMAERAPAPLIEVKETASVVMPSEATLEAAMQLTSISNQQQVQVELRRVSDIQTAAPLAALTSEDAAQTPSIAPAPTNAALLTEASTTIAMSDSMFATLDRVNRNINTLIRPATDDQIYGQSEVWAMPLTQGMDRRGDCEDYALEKRQALVNAGIPASALYFAVGYSRETGRHAVLVVSTNQGDYVLDNMTSEIKPWFETDYLWISRQVAGDPTIWARAARG